MCPTRVSRISLLFYRRNIKSASLILSIKFNGNSHAMKERKEFIEQKKSENFEKHLDICIIYSQIFYSYRYLAKYDYIRDPVSVVFTILTIEH